MNVTDARQVLQVLIAAWPWAEWPDETVELWLAALSPYEPEHARAAAVQAVRELEMPPPIAWFHKACRAERERLTEYRPEIEAAPVDKEQGKRLAAEARAALHRKMPLSLGEAIKQHRTELKSDAQNLDSDDPNASPAVSA